MGMLLSNFDSKRRCTVREDGCTGGIGWDWKGLPGEHSPYPAEKFAENDLNEVLYCFIDVLVAFKVMSKCITVLLVNR